MDGDPYGSSFAETAKGQGSRSRKDRERLGPPGSSKSTLALVSAPLRKNRASLHSQSQENIYGDKESPTKSVGHLLAISSFRKKSTQRQGLNSDLDHLNRGSGSPEKGASGSQKDRGTATGTTSAKNIYSSSW